MGIHSSGLKYKILVIFLLLASFTGILLANFSQPELGVTGGFGQQTCNQQLCHSGNALNAPGGSLTINGVPAEYQPGQTYPITVTLARTGQSRWGFELAVRAASDGQQAGNITVTDGLQTERRTQFGIQYIHHTLSGTAPNTPGPKSWTFNWTAPATQVGVIRFNAAGNAANNNNTNLGDFIYTAQVDSNPPSTTPPPPGPGPSLPITALFSHVAVGAGYTTIFTLMNTGAEPVSGNLVLRDQQGNPFDVNLAETGGAGSVGNSFPVTIEPGGARFFVATAADGGASLKSGWARVESAGGNVGGVGTFQLGLGATLQTVAGVLASDSAEAVTIPVDNSGSQNRFTGFAIANQNSEDVSIRLSLLDENGTVLETVSPAQLSPLGAQKQVAVFLHQIFPARATFRGSMALVVQGGKKASFVALVQNQSLLTAVPVIREKAPQVPN
jgi:hypothetical protein